MVGNSITRYSFVIVFSFSVSMVKNFAFVEYCLLSSSYMGAIIWQPPFHSVLNCTIAKPLALIISFVKDSPLSTLFIWFLFVLLYSQLLCQKNFKLRRSAMKRLTGK